MTMSAPLSNEDIQAAWVNLAEEVRTGVLLTLREGRPFGSHVPYVFGEHWTRAYIHVSRLALHTEHLLRDSSRGTLYLGAGSAWEESLVPTADESSG